MAGEGTGRGLGMGAYTRPAPAVRLRPRAADRWRTSPPFPKQCQPLPCSSAAGCAQRPACIRLRAAGLHAFTSCPLRRCEQHFAQRGWRVTLQQPCPRHCSAGHAQWSAGGGLLAAWLRPRQGQAARISPGPTTTVPAAFCATRTASHTVTARSRHGAEGCAQHFAGGGSRAARLPTSASRPQLSSGQRPARRGRRVTTRPPRPRPDAAGLAQRQMTLVPV